MTPLEKAAALYEKSVAEMRKWREDQTLQQERHLRILVALSVLWGVVFVLSAVSSGLSVWLWRVTP